VYGSKTQKAGERLLVQCEASKVAPIVLEIDRRLERHLAPAGTKFCTYESYLTEDDLEAGDETAAEFARRWYKVGAKDTTVLGGISQGAIQEMGVFLKAVLLFKNLECAYRILTTENIEHVYVGEGVSLVRWAWLAMANKHNTAVTLLPLDHPEATASPLTEQVALWRHWPRRLAGAAWRGLRKLKHVALSLIDGADETKPRVQTSRITLAIREGRATCATWFDQLRASPGIDLLPFQNKANFPTRLQKWIGGLVWFRWVWYRYRQSLRAQPVYTYRNVDIWPYWKGEARQRFTDQFPATHYRAQYLLTWIRQNAIRGLVMPWHELNCLDYEVAQAAGTPLIVFQDSWLPGEHFPPGYRRFMRCHHLLVWGEISASWARHLESVAIHIVGNPKAPTLGLRSCKAIYPGKEQNRPLTVLLTHQCWGPWTAFHSPLDTNDMWDAFAKAARRLPEVHFVGKIHPLVDHPSHEWPGRSDEIRQWVSAQNLPNFRVLPLQSSMQEGLQEADLVVTYYSLTAVEAQTQGIPVAMMNLTSKRDLFPELVKLGGAPAVRALEDLVSLIMAIQNRAYRLDNATVGLEHFWGKVFGTPENVAQTIYHIVEGRRI
jgi:hypothetical protein